MTTTTTPERTVLETYETAALEHVNDVRADLGLEPLDELQPGRKGKAEACPIANSIIHEGPDYLTCNTYWSPELHRQGYNEEGDTIVLDSRVGRDSTGIIHESKMSDDAGMFQRAFDRGEYPQLVADNG